MKKFLILFFVFIINNFLYSQTDSLYIVFNQANKAYKDNDFELAIEKYNQIVESEYHSAELYYNIGNAYFKQKDYPKAILYYQKASKLSPRDEDIKHNIEYANQFVSDEFIEVPEFVLDRIYFSIVRSFSSNTWALISINSFIFSLALFFVFLFSKIRLNRKLAFFTSIVLVAVSVSSFKFSADMKKYQTHPNSGIIMNISTLKSSPGNDGTDLYILNPGTKVKIKSENDEWIEVRLPNGKIGWLKKTSIEPI